MEAQLRFLASLLNHFVPNVPRGISSALNQGKGVFGTCNLICWEEAPGSTKAVVNFSTGCSVKENSSNGNPLRQPYLLRRQNNLPFII